MDTPRTDGFIAMCRANGMNLENALQEHAEALERDAVKELAALVAERDRYKDVLKKIASCRSYHPDDVVGLAAKALTPSENT